MLLPVLFKSLVILLVSFMYATCQDVMYGTRMPNFMGPTGTTSGTGGYSSGPSSSPSVSGISGRGRIVSNSILEPDEADGWNDMENGSMQNIQRQPSGFAQAMPMQRPVLTGPSVVTGKMLVPDTAMSSVGGENRPMSGVAGAMRSTMPANSSPTTATAGSENNLMNDMGMEDRKVYRYVSVHVPPPLEPIVSIPRPTQTTPKPETHYQIVFIKAPSASPQELQEIQLPPPPKLKTLVYVLLKKPEMNDFVKINQPPKVKPSKPEVFFIQYKGEKPQQPRQPGSMMMMMTNNSGNNLVNTNNNGTPSPTQRARVTSTTSTSRPASTGMGMPMGMVQNLGGYDDSEIADSDFSHDTFNENTYSHSSYQRHNINQPQLRSFPYSPAASHSHYGIIK